jgi:ribose transport system substrate-binding protein
MKKFSVKLIVVICILLLACSCAFAAPASEGKLRFTLVLPMGANEVWNACADGFQAACDAIGATATIVSPSKANDANEMNALVETAIAENADGVVTQGVNPVGQAPAFAQMDKAGIPYCLVNSDAVDSNRLAFIGTGDALGIVGGKTISEALKGQKIYFATALFSTSAPIAISLHEAYLSELKKHPDGFEELVVLETKSDQLTSVQEWTNALMTYPNVNAGMNICGFGGLGAARAMQELGYKPGEKMVIAIDDVPETLDRIRDGYLFGTMTQNFFRMGYETVLWLRDFKVDGRRPAAVVNDSGTMLVTKENIETYKADMRNPEKW